MSLVHLQAMEITQLKRQLADCQARMARLMSQAGDSQRLAAAAFQEGFEAGSDHRSAPWRHAPLQIAWAESQARKQVGPKLSGAELHLAANWDLGNHIERRRMAEQLRLRPFAPNGELTDDVPNADARGL